MISMPIFSFANISKTETSTMSCCSKKGKTLAKKMSCCNNKKSTANEDGCGGNCKHKSGECPASCFIIAFNAGISPFTKTFIIASKAKIIITETLFLSKGFYSIWLPPDIA